MKSLLLILTLALSLTATAQQVEISVINSVVTASPNVEASGGAPIFFEDSLADHFLVSTTSADASASLFEQDEIPDISLTVYPNPAINELNLNDTYEQVYVYNMQGRLVINELDANRLRVSQLPSGTYLIKARSGTQVVNSKFIKK